MTVERCGFLDDRHDRRYGYGKLVSVRQCFGRGAGRRSELAGHPRQPGRAVQQRAARRSIPPRRTSSFNGINLLNGDTLKLTFNETGKSTLSITGVTFNDAGLGLSTLDRGHGLPGQRLGQQGVDHAYNASTTLRAEASAFGSNLSIVQIRQDFNKNLINVLQTGASNLTLADSNEEAANSQALSTRQSIAVSALALANQSQQSVLQLLR